MSYLFQYELDPRVKIPSKSDLEEFAPDYPSGWFDSDNGNIYIIRRASKWEKELIYFHESSHADCYANRCHCWNYPTEFWCEYHAFLGEFEKVIYANHPILWETWIKQWKDEVKKYRESKAWCSHLKAVRKLFRRRDVRIILASHGVRVESLLS